MAVGKQSAPVRHGAVTLIKVGAVVMFTTNFLVVFSVLLDCMEYMLDAVTAYVGYSPSFNCSLLANPSQSIGIWQRVDCTIEFLIGGIISPINLFFGITGFLLAALFSQSVGLFVGLIGILIIGQLLWACVRAVYIFLSAYIAFALMAVISPLFIPLILFQATKGYFEKWLRITMGFILQPIFLFTYLAMLMAAYDVVVYTGPNSLYRIIAGSAVDNPGFKFGRWVYVNGVYGESSQSGQAYNVNPIKTLDLVTQDTNVGIVGTARNNADLRVKVTEQLTSTDPTTEHDAWFQANGLPKDIIANNLNLLDYFRVDLPVKAIDWERLAAIHGYAPADIADFWINLMLSAIMALLISYIFLLLLDLLPFIGSGVVGDVLSMPAFGTGPFAPPGDSSVTSIKGKLMGNLMGGRGGG